MIISVQYCQTGKYMSFSLCLLLPTFGSSSPLEWLTGNGRSWWGRCWRPMQCTAGSPWPATVYTVPYPTSIDQRGCMGCTRECRKHLDKMKCYTLQFYKAYNNWVLLPVLKRQLYFKLMEEPGVIRGFNETCGCYPNGLTLKGNNVK